ncbi:Uncharacterized protein TCM_011983 [Theobroma cacao]|uniref:Uncharacterized protein n=1 Tax=Theobroma cacao TaxID=3641 RepID=A0A061FTT8_THECC|nr:Uncharacterized protein TCM_011983 [Theobroma cacao]
MHWDGIIRPFVSGFGLAIGLQADRSISLDKDSLVSNSLTLQQNSCTLFLTLPYENLHASTHLIQQVNL